MREIIVILSKWTELPEEEKKKITKDDKEIMNELMKVLKYWMRDNLETDPFISIEFAQKMNEMTTEEYDKYLQQYTDESVNEGS